VLGILSVEKQEVAREAIRRTWLPGGAAADILSLFVLRGINALDATFQEASTYGDVVFLRANATLTRMVGPIWSTWLWLECAVEAWPSARLLGKAEVDVWLHLPGIAARLLADLKGTRICCAVDRPHDVAVLSMPWIDRLPSQPCASALNTSTAHARSRRSIGACRSRSIGTWRCSGPRASTTSLGRPPVPCTASRHTHHRLVTPLHLLATPSRVPSLPARSAA
jgi:hypothetical protein